MNPLAVALRGKGPFNLARRAFSILGSYGVTPDRMEVALRQFVAILDRFNCRATFPITAVALERHPRLISQYAGLGIEFAIHGYRHIDHCQLTQEVQATHLALAAKLFERVGLPARGFRGPYLHANSDTLAALLQQGLAYDSSQGLAWDVLDGAETEAYRHALHFYGALSANDYPALPSLEGDLVRIPYSLPDDEALAHRLGLQTPDQMCPLWLALLRRSYELGELFTLGLHPERTFLLQEPLRAVLAEARRLDPPVWIARLDEIAGWWRARSQASASLTDTADGRLQVTVARPLGTSVLARGVQTDAPTRPWADGYLQVQASTFSVQAPLRPVIGLAPGVSPALSSFLRQQGYLVETSTEAQRYACYLDQADFTPRDQRPLLARLDAAAPLLRLGRWPNGARCALAITGDIDALTLWDYALRFSGR